MTDHILDRLVAAVGTQYLVEAEIGRGGMAVVYRAMDTRLHRQVAIKVLPPELAFNAEVRERFLREAQTSAQLAHPGIVPIYTVGEAEGLVYFVMALVPGESLAQRLARDGRLPPAQARAILVAVADALAYAHSRGVVHRDVKPDNIMLEQGSGRALVTDFGIARAAAGDSRLTLTGVAIGTPAYMSPEQALGERELDGRSDIYSLGVIGYQMLAGETPFRAANTPAMLVKHVSERPRPLLTLRPDAPPALAHAIDRALAKRPEDRWPDAGAFRDALSGAAPSPPYEEPPRAGHEDMRAHAAPSWRAPVPLAAPPAPLAPRDVAARQRPAWMPPLGPVVPQAGAGGAVPPMPPMPTWGSRADWREWRRAQKEWERARRRQDDDERRARRGDRDRGRPVEERIARLRRNTIGAAATIGITGVINAIVSPDFVWFLIPSAVATISVFSTAANLWSDGVPLSRMFSRGRLADLPAMPGGEPGARSLADPALALAPAEVVAGPHGAVVRRAAEDQRAAREILARLAPAERELIPDVAPTIDALAERVGSLALTLHRLDADVAGASVPSLERRLAALRAEAGESPSADQERRISLLDRQRASIAELTGRRDTLASQLESASLALQNLRLDLLKLRSSGFGGAMSDASSATQEARAVSRDIAHAVDALREANRL